MAFLKLLRKTAFSVLKTLSSHWRRIRRSRKRSARQNAVRIVSPLPHQSATLDDTFHADLEERRRLEGDDCSFVTLEETSQEEGIVWATGPSSTLCPHHSEDLLSDIEDDDDWYVPVSEEDEPDGSKAGASTTSGHIQEVAHILAKMIILMQQARNSDDKQLQDVVMESMLDVDGQD